MTQRFRIDGVEYDAECLTAQGKAILECMKFAQMRHKDLMNQQALLIKAKNAYVADLRTEIIQGRTGVELSSLFSDD